MSSARRCRAKLAEVPADSFPWSEDSEIARIAAFDIGIMPLHDTPWERGKCAYKLLQVMAAGKPVIASPVGANVQVVQHGVNGFLANTTEEWSRRIAPAHRRCRPAAAHGCRSAQDRRRSIRDGADGAAPGGHLEASRSRMSLRGAPLIGRLRVAMVRPLSQPPSARARWGVAKW